MQPDFEREAATFLSDQDLIGTDFVNEVDAALILLLAEEFERFYNM